MPRFARQISLNFSDTGGKGEPVLLLHGLGSRSVDWRPQIEALAGEFRVLTLDFPGHGDSDPLPGPVTMADLAAGAAALLDHLNILRAHVVGFSLGGMVAFQMAVDCPKRLSSLTVINAAPGPGDQRNWFRFQITLRRALLRVFNMRYLAKRIAAKLFPSPAQQALRDQFLASMAVGDRNSYLWIMTAIAHFDVWDRIIDCPIPSLIIAADQDYTPVSFKRDFVARMKSAQLVVVPDSGHATPLDKTETCNAELRAFLHRLSQSPSPHEEAQHPLNVT